MARAGDLRGCFSSAASAQFFRNGSVIELVPFAPKLVHFGENQPANSGKRALFDRILSLNARTKFNVSSVRNEVTFTTFLLDAWWGIGRTPHAAAKNRREHPIKGTSRIQQKDSQSENFPGTGNGDHSSARRARRQPVHFPPPPRRWLLISTSQGMRVVRFLSPATARLRRRPCRLDRTGRSRQSRLVRDVPPS